jgi:hypothetical protein
VLGVIKTFQNLNRILNVFYLHGYMTFIQLFLESISLLDCFTLTPTPFQCMTGVLKYSVSLFSWVNIVGWFLEDILSVKFALSGRFYFLFYGIPVISLNIQSNYK